MQKSTKFSFLQAPNENLIFLLPTYPQQKHTNFSSSTSPEHVPIQISSPISPPVNTHKKFIFYKPWSKTMHKLNFKQNDRKLQIIKKKLQIPSKLENG